MNQGAKKLQWSSVLIVPMFWLTDACVDYYLLAEYASFGSALFQPDAVELYMRILISFLFISFGLYAALLLKRADQIKSELLIKNEYLEVLKIKLEQLSIVDPLTGVFNRRKFDESLDVAISNAKRHQHLFGMLMIDIDHFKRVNDEFGHQTGDNVLRTICDLIISSIRDTDQLFRVGGEEFCLIAMMIDKERLNLLAEKIRKAVESYKFDEVGKITISIGTTCFNDGDSHKSIYSRVDAALYSAKHQGRNCTVFNG